MASDFCEALCARGAPDFLNWGCWKTAKAHEIKVIAQRSSLLMSQAWFRGRVGTPQINRICADFSRLKTRLLYANEEAAKFAVPFHRGTEHGLG